MGVTKWVKSNKSSSRTKRFQANDCLSFWKNWTCRNRTTRTTQNSQFWVLHNQIRKTNRRRRITLHHNNVSCHTSSQTTAYLSTQNIDLMSQPPCNPDLAPNDFFLFPYVKNKMRGQHFSTPEEAFKMHVLEIPQSEW